MSDEVSASAKADHRGRSEAMANGFKLSIASRSQWGPVAVRLGLAFGLVIALLVASAIWEYGAWIESRRTCKTS